MSVQRRVHGRWLGRRRYDDVHAEQQRLVELRQAGAIGDTVLLVEHAPVITLGRGAKPNNVLLTPTALARRGFEVVETGRGGDVTLHAPGQLVCYPILDLSPDRCDVRRYVGDLAETMRRFVAEHGVVAGTLPKWIGLWVDRAHPTAWPATNEADLAKIGAIGVKISRWVTMHGFALNLSTDLSLFQAIVPCGIAEAGVISLSEITGSAPSVATAAARVFAIFLDVFDAQAVGYDDESGDAAEATTNTFA